MVSPAAGSVVLVPFPFSDLSEAKLRPAIVLADAGRNDWILCQVTSKPYGDASAITLTSASFEAGSLHATSYLRALESSSRPVRELMVYRVGQLSNQPHREIVAAVVRLLQDGLT